MNFTVERLSIPEVIVVRPRRFGDDRGWFMETYRKDAFVALGITADFVQDNHALSQAAGTMRGLHFQAPPQAQAKLVRALSGAIFDVAVDIRRGSPSYGQWTGARLTAEGGEQLFIPTGFAHGYCSLEPGSQIAYKCDAYFAPEQEGGISAFDPDLDIDWPVASGAMILSSRDRELPRLRDVVSPFHVEASGD